MLQLVTIHTTHLCRRSCKKRPEKHSGKPLRRLCAASTGVVSTTWRAEDDGRFEKRGLIPSAPAIPFPSRSAMSRRRAGRFAGRNRRRCRIPSERDLTSGARASPPARTASCPSPVVLVPPPEDGPCPWQRFTAARLHNRTVVNRSPALFWQFDRRFTVENRGNNCRLNLQVLIAHSTTNNCAVTSRVMAGDAGPFLP